VTGDPVFLHRNESRNRENKPDLPRQELTFQLISSRAQGIAPPSSIADAEGADNTSTFTKKVVRKKSLTPFLENKGGSLTTPLGKTVLEKNRKEWKRRKTSRRGEPRLSYAMGSKRFSAGGNQ